jgi:hypothetical protein
MTAPATRVAAGKPLLDSKRQPAGKPQPAMCVVVLGYGFTYAMPMADGLAVMRAMSSAVEVEREWPIGKGDEKYQVRRPAQADLRMIQPGQLIPLQPVATKPTTGPDQP